MLSWSHINDERQRDTVRDGDAQEDGSHEMDEAREARHNAMYRQALILHGQGGPHSDEWARAKQLYDNVLSDGASSTFKSPIRFLCLKNMADMFEREGDDVMALQGNIAAAEEDETDLVVWLKMARIARRGGVLNLARLALERLLANREDHVLALRTLKDILLEIGDDAAFRQVASRLDDLDPYGAACTSTMAPNRMLPTAIPSADEIMPPPPESHSVIERSLELPSWERLGVLLLDIQNSVLGNNTSDLEEVTDSSHQPQQESNATDEVALLPEAPEFLLPSHTPPTLSTPVRVLLAEEYRESDNLGANSNGPTAVHHSSDGQRRGTDRPTDGPTTDSSSRDDAKIADSASGSEVPVDAGRKATVLAGGRREGGPRDEHHEDNDHRQQQQEQGKMQQQQRKQQEQKRQQQLQRLWRRRRPAVLQAMEELSDGSSTDDSDGEDGGGGKGGKGKGSGGRWGKYKRGVERRTSGRLQKQDEMVREANVAAARENNMQFRLASLFFPGEAIVSMDKPDKESDSEDEAQRGEGQREDVREHISWWPHLAIADKGGEELGGGAGETGDTDEDGTALADRVLPRWKKRHGEDCCRCGGAGMLVCCDFCHLVFHPKCLEVTPALSSLFACPDCKEEAANLFWELQTRNVTASFLEGGLPGLRALLRAADGRGGNAGVVDLMLRWLQAVAEAPPGELCSDRHVDGLDTEPTVSRLATVALTIEPIVRGYLPARASWPPTVSVTENGFSSIRPGTTQGGLELGLTCELALAEMHLDKALAPSPVGCSGNAGTDTTTTAGSPSTAPTLKAPAASDKTTTLSSLGGAMMVASGGVVLTAAVKAPSGAGATGGGGADKSSALGGAASGTDKSQESVHRSVEPSKYQEAAMRRHLSIADLSMMKLEPFLCSWNDDESSSIRRRPQRGNDNGDGKSTAGQRLLRVDSHIPWAIVVRWWWLRGLRARHAGDREAALKCFRRCEGALMVCDEKKGRGEEGKRGEQEHMEQKTAVVLPYCVVNPRIDAQVVRGVIADMELSGTSEAARAVFEGAIKVLSAQASPAMTEGLVNPSGGVAECARREERLTITDGAAAQKQSGTKPIVASGSAEPKRGGTQGLGTGLVAQREGKESNSPGEGLEDDSARVTIEDKLLLGPSDGAMFSTANGAAADRRTITASSDQATSTVGVAELPKVSSSDGAKAALASLLRGLESRFVEQVPLDATTRVGTARAVDAGGAPMASDDRSEVVQAGSKSKLLVGRACWSIRIPPHRMEELLADLLEREKAFLSKINREGALALQTSASTTSTDSNSSSAPHAASATALSRQAGSARAVKAGGELGKEARPPCGGDIAAASDGTSSVSSGSCQQSPVLVPGHFPLAISGPGFGTHGSVFSMMLRSALIVGRYETAVLLAVRCAEHMLDLVETLSSPRGPLRVREETKRLGMVSLLLTSQMEPGGAARRQVDAATTSACSEFLAYSLSVALWATPHQIRAELFGGPKGDDATITVTRPGRARRNSVLRCLARIIKYSMDSDNVHVLDLSVRAWHAIIAVTPPVATPRPHLTMEVEEVELEPTACKSFAPFSEAEGCAMKADPFDDPANALVRCLCGIVTGRWKQAASALKGGSTPKKAWDLHAVEAIHFLTGMVKDHNHWSSQLESNGDTTANHHSEDGNHPTSSDISIGRVRRFFSNPEELQEIMASLMGLSRLAQGNAAIPSSAALYIPTSSSFPPSMNMGLRLACTLAVLAIGMSGDASQMDAPRKVELLEALHDHLRGNSDLPEGQPGRNGVCADGGGVFLKTSLLYLASPEVCQAVEEERRIQRELGSGCPSESSDEDNSDTGGGEEESDDADAMQDDADADGQAGGNGNSATLGERVVRAVAQCQSCLYDVAMMPSKDHRCLSTPSPPSTAAEANALYKFWESRLPNLRRTRAVRLYEAVIANAAFASPPPTRFSQVVEKHLFAAREAWEGSDGMIRAGEISKRVVGGASESEARERVGERKEQASVGGCSGDGQQRSSLLSFRKPKKRELATSSCEGMSLQDVLALLVSEPLVSQCNGDRCPEHERKGAPGGDTPISATTAAADNTITSATSSHASDQHVDDNTISLEGNEDSVTTSMNHAGRDSGTQATGTSAPPTVKSHVGPCFGVGESIATPAAGDCSNDLRIGSIIDNDPEQAQGVEAKGSHALDPGPSSTGDVCKVRTGGAKRWEAGRRELGLPHDLEAFSAVYLGLYRYLSEAKGVPSGFKYRMTKQPADEVMSDMEAALTQGVRWRVFDLRISPDRMSSWKGLAQCAARLVAIYLDAFTPTCHRLELPLTIATEHAATTKVLPENNTLKGSFEGTPLAEQRQPPEKMFPQSLASREPTLTTSEAPTLSPPPPSPVLPLVPATPGCSSSACGSGATTSGDTNSNRTTSGDDTNGKTRIEPGAKTPSAATNTIATTAVASANTPSTMDIDEAAEVPAPIPTPTGVVQPKAVDAYERSRLSPDTTAVSRCPTGAAAEASSVQESMVEVETQATTDIIHSAHRHAATATAPAESLSSIDERASGPDFPGTILESRPGDWVALPSCDALERSTTPTPQLASTGAELEHKPEAGKIDEVASTPSTTEQHPTVTAQTTQSPTHFGSQALQEISFGEHTDSVFGLRATPGPDISPFFNGTALDSHAARAGVVVRDGGWGAIGVGSRVAAIAEGLRRAGIEGRARTATEGAALRALGTRILDGTATKEEWDACLGHACIAAAATLAERSFAVWRTLAEASMARCRQREGHQDGVRGSDESEEEATVELAECCEEEAFMTYMIARDVWADNEDEDPTSARTATSTDDINGEDVTIPCGHPTAAGLEVSAQRRLLEKALALLRRAKYLRTTDGKGSPLGCNGFSSAHRSSRRRRRRRRRSSPYSSDIDSHRKREHSGKGSRSSDGEKGQRTDEGGDMKRQKVDSRPMKVESGVLRENVSGVGKAHDGCVVERREGGGKGVGDRQGEEDDLLPWQIPFVMGRLCARLGRHPKMILENLSQALRLAKDEKVPLEDELEALCRLHAARAEFILSGDDEHFLSVAHLVESHTFDDDDADTSTSSGSSSPVPALGKSVGHSDTIAQGLQNAINKLTQLNDTPSSLTAVSQATTGVSAPEVVISDVPSTVVGLAPPSGDRSVKKSVDRSSVWPPTQNEVIENVHVRRLAALENCLVAFESCLKRHKWQHTAIYGIANVLLKGEAIAVEARKTYRPGGITGTQERRTFGAKAARLVMSRLFEKRPQHQWLGVIMADGMAGPGLAILGMRRRKLRALRRKYLGLYVDLLEVTKGTVSLHNLHKRARAAKESREEVAWVQERVLRALLTVLQSEVRTPIPAPAQSTLQLQAATSAPLASPPTAALVTSPPPAAASAALGLVSVETATQRLASTLSSGVATSVSRAAVDESTSPPQDPYAKPTASTPGHVGIVAGGNAATTAGNIVGTGGGGQQQGPGGEKPDTVMPLAAPTVVSGSLGETERPQSQQELQQAPQKALGTLAGAGHAVPGHVMAVAPTDLSGSPPEANASTSAATTASTSTGVPTGAGGIVVAQEKTVLERAWDLYLKLLELTGRQGALPMRSSLLGDAEGMLIQAWEAFGAANPAMLDMVEMQSPPRLLESMQAGRSGGGGGGGGGRGTKMQRAQACCNVLWPDRLGKGKVAKSKLRLKRPATGPSQSAANRAAPKPRVRPSAPTEKAGKVSPAPAGGVAGAGLMVEPGASAAGGSVRAGGGGGTGTTAGGGDRAEATAAATPAEPAALAKTLIGTGAAAAIGSYASTSVVTQARVAGASVAMATPPSTSVSPSPMMEADASQGMAAASATAKGTCAEASDRLAHVDVIENSKVTTAPEVMVLDVTAPSGTMSLASQLAPTQCVTAPALAGEINARSVGPVASANAQGSPNISTARIDGSAEGAEPGSATISAAGFGEVGPSYQGTTPRVVQHDGNDKSEITTASPTPPAVGGPAVGPSRPSHHEHPQRGMSAGDDIDVGGFVKDMEVEKPTGQVPPVWSGGTTTSHGEGEGDSDSGHDPIINVGSGKQMEVERPAGQARPDWPGNRTTGHREGTGGDSDGDSINVG